MENNILQISKEILSQINIVEIISHYIQLTKKGRNYTALCPFHDDKKLGNFYVSEEKQIFRCFSCQTSGNAINFVQKKENISYYEALLKVCEIANIHDDRIQKRTKTNIDPLLEDAYKCLNSEVDFYFMSLTKSNEGKSALEYLANRGLNEDVIKYFKIGYAQSNGTLLIDYLKNKNFSLKTIVNTGIARIEDNPIKDINNGRIVFPIFNKIGQPVGFSARVFKNKSDAKYVNTRETIAFNKSSLLYNYHNALQEAKRVGYIYVLEGFMDVIACYRVGIKSAVALMGTSLTKQHLQLLRYTGAEIRLCLDLDNPGQNAMAEIIQVLDNEGLNYRLVSNLTSYEGKDSDEILKNNKEEGLTAFLNNLISKGEWLINYYSKNINLSSLEGRKELVNKMVPFLVKVNDSLELEDYCVRISKLSQFSLENIKTIIRKYKASKADDDKKTYQERYRKNKFEKTTLTKLELAEKQLMQYILENNDALKIYDKKLGFMSNEIYRNIVSLIEDYIYENSINKYNVNDIISYLSLKDGDNDKKQIIIDELAELSLNKKYVLPPYSEEIINELISTINIEREKARTIQAFKEGSKGKSQSEQALQAQNYINKKRAMIEHLENKK